MSDAAIPRLERLLAMSARLVAALRDDVDALERGRPREFKLADPELQRLAAQYEREAVSFGKKEMEAAPADLRARYIECVQALRDLLKKQQRLLTRMRHVSEGMIRAVADELSRREAAARPYSIGAARTIHAPGAMLYNRTV